MLKKLWEKYREIIMYLVFGVLTTFVNIAIYYINAVTCNLNTAISTILAWLAAVLFAYITNRVYVFQSAAKNRKDIVCECISFFGMRLFSGILDLVIMLVFVDKLHYNEMLIKLISNAMVIIINYLASKLFIFRKRTEIEGKSRNEKDNYSDASCE